MVEENAVSDAFHIQTANDRHSQSKDFPRHFEGSQQDISATLCDGSNAFVWKTHPHAHASPLSSTGHVSSTGREYDL